MLIWIRAALLGLCLALLGSQCFGAPERKKPAAKPKAAHPPHSVAQRPARLPAPLLQDGVAELRLIEIYRLIGQSETRAALNLAESLVREFPDFALAQLVYGDLLTARTQAIEQFGNVPASDLKKATPALNGLRLESQMRLRALRERPPANALPAELLKLSPQNKHAIAVDASRARLYLFQNLPEGPKLLADYYISVGKLGIDKEAEGDLRTPLGVYFITSQLDKRTLKDFYGSGALPINYPNVLDVKRGKTGSGIWLHGTPPGQFSRPPQDSDGCIVLANPDLERILKTVEIRSTPVVIARQLKWVPQQSTRILALQFEALLSRWVSAKVSGDTSALAAFYAADFSQNGKSLSDWLLRLERDAPSKRGRMPEIKDLSLLHWVDSEETMVVSFGEVAAGERTGVTRRQYWVRQAGEWKIFYEGVNG
jgi:L,D-transpeptidase YnhG